MSRFLAFSIGALSLSLATICFAEDPDPSAADYVHLDANPSMSKKELAEAFFQALRRFWDNPDAVKRIREEHAALLKLKAEIATTQPTNATAPQEPLPHFAIDPQQKELPQKFRLGPKVTELNEELAWRRYARLLGRFGGRPIAIGIAKMTGVKPRALTFGEILSAIKTTEIHRKTYSADDQQWIINQFIDQAIKEITTAQTLKDTTELASYVSDSDLVEELFELAIQFQNQRWRIGELLAHALAHPTILESSFRIKRRLVDTAITALKMNGTESDFWRSFVESYILFAPTASYKRDQLLKSISFFLTEAITPDLVETLFALKHDTHTNIQIIATVESIFQDGGRHAEVLDVKEALERVRAIELILVTAKTAVCSYKLGVSGQRVAWFSGEAQ